MTLYSDCVEAIRAMHCGSGVLGDFTEEMEAGTKLLRDNPGWRLRHIFREGNGIADLLARFSRAESWSWSNLDAVPRLLQLGMAQ